MLKMTKIDRKETTDVTDEKVKMSNDEKWIGWNEQSIQSIDWIEKNKSNSKITKTKNASTRDESWRPTDGKVQMRLRRRRPRRQWWRASEYKQTPQSFAI